MEEVNVKTAIVLPGVFRCSRIIHHQERAYVNDILESGMNHEGAKLFGAMKPGVVYTVCITKSVDPALDDMPGYLRALDPPSDRSMKHTTTVDIEDLDWLIKRMLRWEQDLPGKLPGEPDGYFEASVAADIRRALNHLGYQRTERERKIREQIERERIYRRQGYAVEEGAEA